MSNPDLAGFYIATLNARDLDIVRTLSRQRLRGGWHA